MNIQRKSVLSKLTQETSKYNTLINNNKMLIALVNWETNLISKLPFKFNVIILYNIPYHYFFFTNCIFYQ